MVFGIELRGIGRSDGCFIISEEHFGHLLLLTLIWFIKAD